MSRHPRMYNYGCDEEAAAGEDVPRANLPNLPRARPHATSAQGARARARGAARDLGSACQQYRAGRACARCSAGACVSLVLIIKSSARERRRVSALPRSPRTAT